MTCKCGRPSKIKSTGECRNCYMIGYRRRPPEQKHRTACVQGFFDWVRVCRAWAGENRPDDRPLTRAEQEYLASLLCQADYSDRTKGKVLGMADPNAAELVEKVRSGAVDVPVRDWQGLPV